jgi:hypothetical protein
MELLGLILQLAMRSNPSTSKRMQVRMNLSHGDPTSPCARHSRLPRTTVTRKKASAASTM